MWEGLQQRFPGRPMLMTTTKAEEMSYLMQYSLWRRARVVVGMHGGGLAGALWLSPGQTLVEVSTKEQSTRYPGMFSNLAVANGAEFVGVSCENCTHRGGGNVDVPALLAAVERALNGSRARGGWG